MNADIATNSLVLATNTVVTNFPPAGAALKDHLRPLEGILKDVLDLSPAMLLVLSLVIFGRVLKGFPPIHNRWIPAILFPAGAVGWCMMNSWTIMHFLQGQLFGGCAVGLNQLWKLSFSETISLILGKAGGWMSTIARRVRRSKPEHHDKPKPPTP